MSRTRICYYAYIQYYSHILHGLRPRSFAFCRDTLFILPEQRLNPRHSSDLWYTADEGPVQIYTYSDEHERHATENMQIIILEMYLFFILCRNNYSTLNYNKYSTICKPPITIIKIPINDKPTIM